MKFYFSLYSISSAYSFGSTSNTEIGTELEMSATATMGFDDNNNVAITAGVTAWASRNWEKTWTRDGSESYGETRTSSMSWSITCTARCYCERDILVAKKTYSIPYTLTASTLNNPDVTCVEEGELYIGEMRSWIYIFYFLFVSGIIIHSMSLSKLIQ